MTGRFECPDQLTWLIHLCRSPARFHRPVFENSMAFRQLIFVVYCALVNRHGLLKTLKVELEELVSPYFPKTFPKSTLIYYYMTVAQDFGKSAIQISDAAGLDAAPQTPRFNWGHIKGETAYLIEWLETQTPNRQGNLPFCL